MARKIIEALHVDWVSILSMDSFYKVLSPVQHEKAAKNEYNFDHPGVCARAQMHNSFIHLEL